ncbi:MULTISPECIES: porin [unclassified Rhizobium]|uniref:porin n=1 Tax=unclassified Rhizobium TaxID=2613769 RepID=UPI0006F62C3F|nr:MULTISPECIES: porin [unclassified Rhizobium]KQV43481.1 hypothetical protein ASC86_01300 [Rhizobium sp. Root1212]KRD37666.1 hypothetical protein ASE37_01300 [Rhizobium sp. Root268]
MNIKSLLLGSAAALAAVSGAHAADAIVAAEPEPMEYVRVCDAFGTGYFYIPGTETCLSISGYVRTQIEYNDSRADDDDWGTYTRAYLTFAAKNDTEFGTLSSYINLQADSGHTWDVGSGGDVILDGAWIEIAGFKIGYFYNWWDDFGLAGETDETGGNLFNSIQYTYDAGSFQVGASVEDLDADVGSVYSADQGFGHNDDVGISGLVRGTFGGVDALLIASYDFDVEEAAFKARLTAAVGPGTFGIAGIYATDPNAYWSDSEWSVVASYELKATDKFTITPAAQYFGSLRDGTNGFGDDDAWKVGLTAGYQITDGLRTLATINYKKIDTDADIDDDSISGFVRLQRDF